MIIGFRVDHQTKDFDEIYLCLRQQCRGFRLGKDFARLDSDRLPDPTHEPFCFLCNQSCRSSLKGYCQMRNNGKRTPKDDIIDMIEDECFEEGFDDDTVERLHKMSAADLFLLQKLFNQARKNGYSSAIEQVIDK